MPQQEASLSQTQAWKDRFKALKDLPHIWHLLVEAAPFAVRATIFLRMLGGLGPLAMLYAAKQILDIIAPAAHGVAINLDDLWFWVGIEFGLAAISQVIGRTVDYLDTLIAENFSTGLGLKIMQHAASLDLGTFEDPAFQDRLERARAQTHDRIGMLTSAGWLMQRIVMLISLSAAIVYYSPWLMLILFVSVVPAFLVESHFAFLGYTLAHSLTPARRTLQYYLTLGSSREAAKEVKIFALASHLTDKYSALAHEIIAKTRALAGRRMRWGSAFTVLAAIGYYASYAYLARAAATGRMSVGTFAMIVGALAGANGHLQAIFSLFSDIADQSLFLRDLILFFNEKPSMHSSNKPLLPPRPIRHGIEFENVSFRYPGSDRLVLDNLSVTFEKGQSVAIVGENGEGKTTLVKLIARLYDPTHGRILLDGRDLREYDVNELRNEIGIIFQDFIRYDLSARENIAVGNINALLDDDALWDASRKSNVHDILERFPKGLDQVLGRRFAGGMDLSGGEWQRLALARAYLRDSQILILDEPTAALDPMAEYEVFQKFADLASDKLAIFISHRLSTVRMADRILLLSNGQIAEDGHHDDLVYAGGAYSRMFEVQASSYR